MSIQSDIEMLSIEALEYYAKKHQLSEDDAFNIFYKHQVFEKILVQHETLHQLDIHDTFQYVEDIIEEDTPTLVLFHGSNIAFDKIDLNKSHNRRDFGRGFYCTVLEQQANEWANRLYLRTHTGGKYVYRYIFQQSEELKIKHFATLDKEWLEFVKLNRTVGDIQHHYDVVIGPVADDNTMETVQLYLSDILSVDERYFNESVYSDPGCCRYYYGKEPSFLSGCHGQILSLKNLQSPAKYRKYSLGGICWLYCRPLLRRTRRSTNKQMTNEKICLRRNCLP